MAQVAFNIDIPPINLYRQGAARELLRQEHTLYIGRVLERGQALAREETPVGATAILRGTITTDLFRGQTRSADIRGDVVWPQPYAAAVERGTAPHFPPIEPLKLWARRVLGDESAAWPIAIAISRRGTPSPRHPRDPRRYAERTRERLVPEAVRLYQDAITRFVRRLGESR